jgi:hypothetical protein
MASMQIEADVPLPRGGRHGTKRSEYRLALEALVASPVGSSFFIPDGTHGKPASAPQIANNLFGSGWFSVRKVEGGQRIWKIAEPKGASRTPRPRIVRQA